MISSVCPNRRKNSFFLRKRVLIVLMCILVHVVSLELSFYTIYPHAHRNIEKNKSSRQLNFNCPFIRLTYWHARIHSLRYVTPSLPHTRSPSQGQCNSQCVKWRASTDTIKHAHTKATMREENSSIFNKNVYRRFGYIIRKKVPPSPFHQPPQKDGP